MSFNASSLCLLNYNALLICIYNSSLYYFFKSIFVFSAFLFYIFRHFYFGFFVLFSSSFVLAKKSSPAVSIKKPEPMQFRQLLYNILNHFIHMFIYTNIQKSDQHWDTVQVQEPLISHMYSKIHQKGAVKK